jgi:hypothetical protein
MGKVGEKSTIQNGKKSIRMGTLLQAKAPTQAKRKSSKGFVNQRTSYENAQ